MQIFHKINTCLDTANELWSDEFGQWTAYLFTTHAPALSIHCIHIKSPTTCTWWFMHLHSIHCIHIKSPTIWWFIISGPLCLNWYSSANKIMLLSVQCTALAAHWTDSKIVCVLYVVCRVSGVQHVGVVTINHAHLLDRPLLVCLSVCLSAPKRLKVRTSNLAGVFPWPLTNISEKWAWSRSRDPVNCGALNPNSSKMAEGTNFKFGRRVPRDSPDMIPDIFPKSGRGHGHVTP